MKLSAKLFSPLTLLIALLSAFLLASCTLGEIATSPAQERKPSGAISDVKLRGQIMEALQEADRYRFGRVKAKVIEGRVLLTGIVKTRDDRIRAARLTWNVKGVREVHNETSIGQAGGPVATIKDKLIASELRAKLLKDNEITDVNFTIEAVNRKIYLMGLAQDRTEHEKVLTHARSLEKANQIIDYIRLKGDDRRPGQDKLDEDGNNKQRKDPQ